MINVKNPKWKGMKFRWHITSTNIVRLYPNVEMKQVLDENCDYRRFCWNKGLEFWNAMYQASKASDDAPKPGRYNVLQYFSRS